MDSDTTFNVTTIINFTTDNEYNKPRHHENNQEPSWVYTKGIPLMILVCIVSVAVNVRVLASVRWIRRPLSATLYISLSLAAADAFTSALLCTSLIINSYMPQIWNIKISTCYSMSVEALRLGGIVTTVLHLTILACNHYLGIIKPLHYPSIMTHGKTSVCLVALWIIPPTYFFIYFTVTPNEGFMHKNCPWSFLKYLRFRLMFTPMLVIPLMTMIVIYTHILIIIRRQQRAWLRSAERGSSCRHRGPTIQSTSNSQQQQPPQQQQQQQQQQQHRNAPMRRRYQHQHHHHYHYYQQQHHHHQHNHLNEQRRNQQMARNAKAVYTTLLILGSYIAGLLPATIIFLFCCEDCLYPRTAVSQEVLWSVNLLVIIKTLANPVIYGARMHEIKEATRRMRTAACRSHICDRSPSGRTCRTCLCVTCCGGAGDTGNDSQQLYNSGSSWRAANTPAGTAIAVGDERRTAVCRLISSNGNAITAATAATPAPNNNNSASTIL